MINSFTLIDVAGAIVPRHMKAVKNIGNALVAALDKSDRVGIIDSFFPEAAFFSGFELFDHFADKYRREKNIESDYVSICAPSYLTAAISVLHSAAALMQFAKNPFQYSTATFRDRPLPNLLNVTNTSNSNER